MPDTNTMASATARPTEEPARAVLVHCHLFKNAGTTLDWSLARSFGEGFVAHTDDAAMRSGPAYLAAYVKDHSRLQALSSHHVQFPMPAVDGIALWPLLLLRHPVDRVGSVYAFEARQVADTPGAVKAKEATFAEYVAWRMEPNVGATIRNVQVRYCCDRRVPTRHALTEEDYEAARRNTRQPLVGTVDRYDESMVLFEETLRPRFPEIDLAYVRQNVTQGRKKSLDERVQHVFDRLGPEASALLVEKNQYDLRLYDATSERLDARIAATPQFEEKLEAFRARCQALR